MEGDVKPAYLAEIPNEGRGWWQFWQPKTVKAWRWDGYPHGAGVLPSGLKLRVWSSDYFENSVREVLSDRR